MIPKIQLRRHSLLLLCFFASAFATVIFVVSVTVVLARQSPAIGIFK